MSEDNPLEKIKNPFDELSHPCKDTCSGWKAGFYAATDLRKISKDMKVKILFDALNLIAHQGVEWEENRQQYKVDIEPIEVAQKALKEYREALEG